MDGIKTKKAIKRPPLEGFYPYIVFLILGFFVADLIVINLRGSMLPDSVPPSRPNRLQTTNFQSRGGMGSITSRNIFSADGKIPETLALKKQKPEDQKEQVDLPPILSSLPLALVGTIVHSNPAKSIANIEVRPKTTVIAVRPNQEIDTLATLLSVERGKVIIRNSSSGRKEYIEIKNLNKISFTAPKGDAPASSGKDEVHMLGQNTYEISRADILKYTADMSAVLQQAAMQPRRKANGEIDCFQFLSIQPGSIYTKLGFQKGDCLKAVNDEPIDSPAKAMQMYNDLKGASNIKIKVERDGRDQNNDYNVKQ